MKTIIKKYTVYDFSELSSEAKEKVKQKYLDSDLRGLSLIDYYKEDIEQIFPNSELKVQWSLSYSQGDGVNIYGSVNLNDIFTLPSSGRAPELDWIRDYLAEKEIKTMRFYMKEYKDYVDLPINRRYAFCIADRIEFAEEFQYELESMGIRDVNTSVLEKTEKMVKQIFGQMCLSYEKIGYDYLYEISDEDMEEICNVNEYYFFKDGSFCNV